MQRSFAVIDARNEAHSLPDLPLQTLYDNVSILQFQSRRLKTIKGIEDLIVLTTDKRCDNAAARMAETTGVISLRAPDTDTLSGLLYVSDRTHADVLIYAPSSNPFCDPGILATSLASFQNTNCEYSRLADNGVPEGFGAEILSTKVLQQLGDDNRLTADMRENVMDFIYQRPDVFRACRPVVSMDVNPPNQSVSISQQADLDMLRAMYITLEERNWPVDMEHVCSLLDEFSVLNSIITGLAS